MTKKEMPVLAKMRPRPAVRQFGKLMELILRNNDYKGKTGWRSMTKNEMLDRIEQEAEELMLIMWERRHKPWQPVDPMKLLTEIADVANFGVFLLERWEEAYGDLQ